MFLVQGQPAPRWRAMVKEPGWMTDAQPMASQKQKAKEGARERAVSSEVLSLLPASSRLLSAHLALVPSVDEFTDK